MTTITLNELEKRIKKNNEIFKDNITKFKKETNNKIMRTGRVRPKHPTEAKILSKFNNKK